MFRATEIGGNTTSTSLECHNIQQLKNSLYINSTILHLVRSGAWQTRQRGMPRRELAGYCQ